MADKFIRIPEEHAEKTNAMLTALCNIEKRNEWQEVYTLIEDRYKILVNKLETQKEVANV